MEKNAILVKNSFIVHLGWDNSKNQWNQGKSKSKDGQYGINDWLS